MKLSTNYLTSILQITATFKLDKITIHADVLFQAKVAMQYQLKTTFIAIFSGPVCSYVLTAASTGILYTNII
jgi:hypothetical protein